jgi:putative ABC transport system ATP-binding protein
MNPLNSHDAQSLKKIRSSRKTGKSSEALKLENISKSYGSGHSEVRALDDANLTIYDGEFIGILGPSGSGKSTLLHIIGLLDTPSSGKVYVDGVDTTKMNSDQKAQERAEKIGFVFQFFNLVPSLSALENVELPLAIYNVPKDVRRKKAERLLVRLGLGKRLGHLPNMLSGGERQRVAIARALVNDPEIVLADEPTGNLDSKTGIEVLKIFEELHSEGRTIVIITHDENITSLTKRVVKIMDGKLIENKVKEGKRMRR